MTKMIWAWPKQFGPDQNNLYPSKTIWTVQNHFGAIEGQGISSCSFMHIKSRSITYLHSSWRKGKFWKVGPVLHCIKCQNMPLNFVFKELIKDLKFSQYNKEDIITYIAILKVSLKYFDYFELKTPQLVLPQ